jgi:hypothetical protein
LLHVGLLVALLLPATALSAAAGGSAKTVKFVSAGRAYQGKPYTVVVASKNGTSCTLAVKYSDGDTQPGLGAARVSAGKATWKWTLPQVAAPGAARLTARCGAATGTRSIVVVGTLIPPKITVLKQGWSVRAKPVGSSVSYGLVLKNTSPNANALKISVQVNFVLADNRLVGTATQSIPMISAGSTFNYAGSLQFPGAAPITKLELVILVGQREKAQKLHQPAVDNVFAVPQAYDPAWTAWVQGEVINDHPTLSLRSTQLSALLFDAAGNVLGGATGSAYNLLPPGTRQIFKLTNGVDAVPYAKIASVAISATPTYETPAP